MRANFALKSGRDECLNYQLKFLKFASLIVLWRIKKRVF